LVGRSAIVFTITSFQSKPLKALRWIAVHGQNIDLIQRECLKVSRQRLDPTGIMVPDRHSLRQIKYSVGPVLWLVANISLCVSFVSLQPKVAYVEETTRPQDTADFFNDGPLPLVGRHTRKD